MSSSIQYNILAGFSAVSKWQANIVRNAQGLLQPGYNKTEINFNSTGGATVAGQKATVGQGGRNPAGGEAGTLDAGSFSLNFQQGGINPAYRPTALAIKGQGFFILAQNLGANSKLYLTRNGDFSYDAQGRLVNAQGLFVVGNNGTATPSSPVVPVTDRNRDGTVTLPDVLLARVPVPNNLGISGYGNLVYELTPGAGPMQALANGDARVGFVQSSSLEMMEQVGVGAQLQFETQMALQTYKLFKDMLDNYNKTVDDALSLVR